MAKHTGAMHVATVKSGYVGKSGQERVYLTHLLRRTFREDGKVKHETLANLSALPDEQIELLRRSLKGEAFVPADAASSVLRSLPHGHVAAVMAQARALELPALLGPAGRERDLALALVVSRVVHPRPKLATLSWWADTTLGVDLGVADASTDEVYAAMDWLLTRQDSIEAKLARRHLTSHTNPHRMALFDLSSSWMQGRHCPLAARGYSRDGKKGKAQIEYGLLTDPAIAALAAADGPLQMSLFDQHDLAEIHHPDYPGERLIACRNPALAQERARKRADLLDATETLLAPIVTAVAEGRLRGAADIGLRVGKVIDKHKMAKHLDVAITDTTLSITRRQANIDAEAALDGIYVIRTSVPANTLDPAGVVTAYKNLSHVERDWRTIKVDDLDLRPIHHRLEDRVKAHVLICMIAAYLVWHLRRAWAPLTYTDHTPPVRDNPVAPAQRSTTAARKASRRRDEHDQPVRSFRNLIDHLATLTRNDIQHGQHADAPVVPTLTIPTPTQRRAFELLDTRVPLTLT